MLKILTSLQKHPYGFELAKRMWEEGIDIDHAYKDLTSGYSVRKTYYSVVHNGCLFVTAAKVTYSQYVYNQNTSYIPHVGVNWETGEYVCQSLVEASV